MVYNERFTSKAARFGYPEKQPVLVIPKSSPNFKINDNGWSKIGIL